MYQVPFYRIPDGIKLNDYIGDLFREIEKENDDIKRKELKDTLFRVSFPTMKKELEKYNNLGSIEEFTPMLAMAFMKTVNNFDYKNKKASFFNYYKMALRSEVISGYYGKYKNKKEHMKLKSKVEGTSVSMETPVIDKQGICPGTWGEMIPDNSFTEEVIINMNYKDAVHQAIDEVFKDMAKGKKTARSQVVFTTYIDSIIDGEEVMQIELAKRYGITKSAVCRTIKAYLPRLKNKMEELEMI